MNYEISNLTDNEHNLITEMINSILQIENILSAMTKSERLAWFRSKHFPRKIDSKKKSAEQFTLCVRILIRMHLKPCEKKQNEY